jgi:hypothetical protein
MDKKSLILFCTQINIFNFAGKWHGKESQMDPEPIAKYGLQS